MGSTMIAPRRAFWLDGKVEEEKRLWGSRSSIVEQCYIDVENQTRTSRDVSNFLSSCHLDSQLAAVKKGPALISLRIEFEYIDYLLTSMHEWLVFSWHLPNSARIPGTVRKVASECEMNRILILCQFRHPTSMLLVDACYERYRYDQFYVILSYFHFTI